eukprot:106305-Amphidinium_carterae.1
MKISLARFSSHELGQLQKLHESDIISKSTLREKRKEAIRCPQPLSDAAFDALVARSSLGVPISEGLSVVGKKLLEARSILQGHVVGVASESGFEWFKFVHALHHPACLMLLPLTVLDIEVPLCENSIAGWIGGQRGDIQMAWQYD